jgi:hypothetical protein
MNRGIAMEPCSGFLDSSMVHPAGRRVVGVEPMAGRASAHTRVAFSYTGKSFASYANAVVPLTTVWAGFSSNCIRSYHGQVATWSIRVAAQFQRLVRERGVRFLHVVIKQGRCGYFVKSTAFYSVCCITSRLLANTPVGTRV